MKKLSLSNALFFIILSVSWASCGKGGGNPTLPPAQKTTEQLLDNGKWTVSKIVLTTSTGAAVNTDGKGTFSFSADGSNRFYLSGLSFTATSGGNGTVAIDSYPTGGIYSYNGGNGLEIQVNGQTNLLVAKITVTANELTLDMTNNSCYYIESGTTYNCTGVVETMTH